MNRLKQSARSTSALVPVLMMGVTFLAAPAAGQTADPQPASATATATATDATPQADAPPGGDIVITARRRSEDILRTPVAVTALSSQDLAVRGVTTINDIANFTPGVNVNNNAAGRNDRSFQQVIIRGFTPSAATNPTSALFIDGAPVASPSAFSSISDPERVEVLKGPQAAYFGRSTFAGAINVVNKVPGDVLAGSVGGMIGTRDNYKLHADLEGPIFGDKLTFRISGDRFSKNGSYENKAVPGQTLGDQKTTSGTVMLVAKPTDRLTIKAFGLLSEDKDGAPAQGLISAYTITNAAGAVVVPGQSNCTLTGRSSTGAAVSNPFFCGKAPKLSSTTPSSNTTNDSVIQDFLANPNGRLVNPDDGVQGYGLVRRYYHMHLGADYEVGDTGVTLSSLTSYNNERYSQLSDLDNYGDTTIVNLTPGGRSYFDFPYLVERINRDFSQELRASYDQGGPFKASFGGSYLNSFSQGGLGGGNGALGTGAYASVVSGATRSRTFGAFYGLSYAVTDKLTLNAEGRYQIDKLYAYAQPTGYIATTDLFVPVGFYAGGSKLLNQNYKNFLPRFIAQYQATPAVMAYASYSKGVNPGLFNTAFLTYSVAQQNLASAAGINVAVSPEKVTNYEIGIKGRFFDNRLRMSLDGYFAPWRSQINAITMNVVDTDTNTTQIIRGSANTGAVDMSGIELDGTFNATRAIALNFSAALTDSKIKKFQNATVTAYSGITDFSGNENPNTSKYAATAGGQYTGDIGGLDGASWFGRVDYSFKSGMWADAANLVKTRVSNTINLRTGASQNGFWIEAFVNNVTNNRSYTTIADASVFTNNFRYSTYNSALIVGLPDLRTYGLQMKYRF